MKISEKTERIHELYLECGEIFEPSEELAEEVFRIEDQEERQFYHLLHSFFLRKKQEKLV